MSQTLFELLLPTYRTLKNVQKSSVEFFLNFLRGLIIRDSDFFFFFYLDVNRIAIIFRGRDFDEKSRGTLNSYEPLKILFYK